MHFQMEKIIYIIGAGPIKNLRCLKYQLKIGLSGIKEARIRDELFISLHKFRNFGFNFEK